jgi:hypothetical protein
MPAHRRRKPRWHCLDCGVNTMAAGHYYMVSDRIWAASGLRPTDGMLCLYCLQHRLGWKLQLKDFTTLVPRAWAPRG